MLLTSNVAVLANDAIISWIVGLAVAPVIIIPVLLIGCPLVFISHFVPPITMPAVLLCISKTTVVATN